MGKYDFMSHYRFAARDEYDRRRTLGLSDSFLGLSIITERLSSMTNYIAHYMSLCTIFRDFFILSTNF